jgi:hypothetical protein
MGQIRLGSTYRSEPYTFSALASTGVPVVIPSSGTIATAGTVTLTTALPTTYSGGAWMYFPATAFAGTVAAGLFWVVMSSTTAGTVYQTSVVPASPFEAFVPTEALVAVVGSNSAYTQTTASDLVLLRTTVPGGLMGVSGEVHYTMLFTTNSTANSKPVKVTFGGTDIHSASLAGNISTVIDKEITNRGVTNRQIANPLAALGHGSQSTASLYLSIDTNSDFDVVITGQINTATDYIVMEYAHVIAIEG